MIISFIVFFKGVKIYNDGEEDYGVMLCAACAPIFILSFFAFIMNIDTGITHLINPDFYAMMKLIGKEGY